MKTTILIPAYNEEQGIKQTIKKLIPITKKMKKTQIIVINDGSTDKTLKIAKEHPVKIIDYKKNAGKGAALKKAFKEIDSDIIVTTDADDTYDPTKIPEMVDMIKQGEADMVIGSRFLGEIKGGMPPLNWLGNKIFSQLVTLITQTKITDTSSGQRAFKKELTQQEIQATGLDYETELTTTTILNGYKVKETPIKYNERKGKSKLNPLLDGWKFLTSIIRAKLKTFNNHQKE